MDWRATTSQGVQTDLDQLLSTSIQVAATGLAHQNLTPFMLVIDTAGKQGLRALGASGGSAAGNDLSSVIAGLQRDDDAEILRARATVLDVTVRAPFTGEAINVHLEHREGLSVDLLVPYRTTADGISVDAGTTQASRDDARLWPLQ